MLKGSGWLNFVAVKTIYRGPAKGGGGGGVPCRPSEF